MAKNNGELTGDDLQGLRVLLSRMSPADLAAVIPTAPTFPVPEGFELVKKQPMNPDFTPEKRLELKRHFENYFSKPQAVIAQELIDRMFPTGSKLFECGLQEIGLDGSTIAKHLHPTVTVKADYEADAKARYQQAFGILALDKSFVTSKPVN